MVYVLNKNGKPLMPCKNVVARLLLKEGKAKVKRKCSFTIQLTYDCPNYRQEVVLGQILVQNILAQHVLLMEKFYINHGLNLELILSLKWIVEGKLVGLDKTVKLDIENQDF